VVGLAKKRRKMLTLSTKHNSGHFNFNKRGRELAQEKKKKERNEKKERRKKREGERKKRVLCIHTKRSWPS